LAPRDACGGGVLRSRFTCRVFGRASILASPSLERRRMTKMPPDGYPALQYLQSVRVRNKDGGAEMAAPLSFRFQSTSSDSTGSLAPRPDPGKQAIPLALRHDPTLALRHLSSREQLISDATRGGPRRPLTSFMLHSGHACAVTGGTHPTTQVRPSQRRKGCGIRVTTSSLEDRR
jgi:hypothetical protein